MWDELQKLDGLATWLTTVIGGGSAVLSIWWGLVARGRPARLRRREEELRGFLESNTPPADRDLVELLHKNVSAQMLSLDLVPTASRFWRPAGLLGGGIIALTLGVLVGASLIQDGLSGLIAGHLWWLLPVLLLASLAMSWPALQGYADEANIRRVLWSDMLDGQEVHLPITGPTDGWRLQRLREHHQPRKGHGPFRGWWAPLLGAAPVFGLAGLGAILISGAVAFSHAATNPPWSSTGWAPGAVAALGVVGLYAGGFALGGWSWAQLVRAMPHPKSPPSPAPPSGGATFPTPQTAAALAILGAAAAAIRAVLHTPRGR